MILQFTIINKRKTIQALEHITDSCSLHSLFLLPTPPPSIQKVTLLNATPSASSQINEAYVTQAVLGSRSPTSKDEKWDPHCDSTMVLFTRNIPPILHPMPSIYNIMSPFACNFEPAKWHAGEIISDSSRNFQNWAIPRDFSNFHYPKTGSRPSMAVKETRPCLLLGKVRPDAAETRYKCDHGKICNFWWLTTEGS